MKFYCFKIFSRQRGGRRAGARHHITNGKCVKFEDKCNDMLRGDADAIRRGNAHLVI